MRNCLTRWRCSFCTGRRFPGPWRRSVPHRRRRSWCSLPWTPTATGRGYPTCRSRSATLAQNHRLFNEAQSPSFDDLNELARTYEDSRACPVRTAAGGNISTRPTAFARTALGRLGSRGAIPTPWKTKFMFTDALLEALGDSLLFGTWPRLCWHWTRALPQGRGQFYVSKASPPSSNYLPTSHINKSSALPGGAQSLTRFANCEEGGRKIMIIKKTQIKSDTLMDCTLDLVGTPKRCRNKTRCKLEKRIREKNLLA